MDFLPTFARLAGAEPPDDRIIDGRDVSPLLLEDPAGTSPHEAFFYYQGDRLNAVRAGGWKLHVARDGHAVRELYDLEADIGETENVIDGHPDVEARLMPLIDACREDLGDAMTGAEGANRRPAGHVDDARPLAFHDEDHPYIIAMYDLPDVG
jgi:arylsulfatase A-like enzyme